MYDEMKNAADAEFRSTQDAWRTLRADWRLSDLEVRELLPDGMGLDGQPPVATETRMRLLIAIGHRIDIHGDDLEDWLRFGTPVLGWLAPLEVMSGGLGDLRGLRDLADRGMLP